MSLGTANLLFSVILYILYIGCVAVIIAVKLKKEKYLFKTILFGIFAVLFLLFLESFLQSGLTYFSWKKDSLSKFLLPPYSQQYFYHYCFLHYFINKLLGIGGAFFVGLFFLVFQKKSFFISSEILLIVFCSLISGWPNLIIFLCMILVFAVISVFIKNYKKNTREKNIFFSQRISLFYPIIISLFFTLIFGEYLAVHSGLNALRI